MEEEIIVFLDKVVLRLSQENYGTVPELLDGFQNFPRPNSHKERQYKLVEDEIERLQLATRIGGGGNEIPNGYFRYKLGPEGRKQILSNFSSASYYETKQTRQLAAIMFTDIVGYTALMGNDEQKTIALLEKNRQLQKPIIQEFNGRWIKETGDGIIASFTTVSDAVHAAVKIQERCTANNDFKLRIGIHLGEVVFKDGDVFGDGVNIAARIQSAADPGCIFISEAIHENVLNKKEINTHFVKEEVLKNVSQPVRIYQVIFSGSVIIKAGSTTTVVATTNEEVQKPKKEKQGMKFGHKLTIYGLILTFVGLTLLFLQLIGVFEKHPTSKLVIKAVSEPRANNIMFTKFVITNLGDGPATNIAGKYITFLGGNLDKYLNDIIIEDTANNQAIITFTQDTLLPFDSIVRASDFPLEEYKIFNSSLSVGNHTSCDTVPVLIYFRANGKEFPCVAGKPF